jgi:hypothetical protein
MTSRRALSLLCLAACAATLVGCAGGDALALDPVARAASTTAHTTSSRFQFRASINAGAVGSMSFEGTGVYDGKGRTGWMNMRFALPPAFRQQVASADPSMEMVFDGSDGLVVYMRSPLFDKMLPADKWVKMDLEKLAKKQGVDLGALMSTNQVDPSQSLGILKAASGARVDGSERIRGVQTTRYAFDIDFKKLAQSSKAFGRFAVAAGSLKAPGKAWVDAQGRVRRLALTLSMGATLGAPMTMTMTEDLYDFGVKVDISPPSGDAVVDLSSLTKP